MGFYLPIYHCGLPGKKEVECLNGYFYCPIPKFANPWNLVHHQLSPRSFFKESKKILLYRACLRLAIVQYWGLEAPLYKPCWLDCFVLLIGLFFTSAIHGSCPTNKYTCNTYGIINNRYIFKMSNVLLGIFTVLSQSLQIREISCIINFGPFIFQRGSN